MAEKDIKYPRETLINSKLFAIYQRDFLAAVLSKPEYTLSEARKAVNSFFRKEAK